MSALQYLFCELRAVGWCHLAAHWQAQGGSAFQTHLLFERLYKDTLDEIDAFAEKLVGGSGFEAVDPVQCAAGMYKVVKSHWEGRQSDPGEAIPAALDMEERFLRDIAEVLESEDLSVGMENFLQGLADKHEGHTYLLKQHLIAIPLVAQWGPTLVRGEET